MDLEAIASVRPETGSHCVACRVAGLMALLIIAGLGEQRGLAAGANGNNQATITMSATLQTAIRLTVNVHGQTLQNGELGSPRTSVRFELPKLTISNGSVMDSAALGLIELTGARLEGVQGTGRLLLVPVELLGQWSGMNSRKGQISLRPRLSQDNETRGVIAVATTQVSGAMLRRLSNNADGASDPIIYVDPRAHHKLYVGWFIADGSSLSAMKQLGGECTAILQVP